MVRSFVFETNVARCTDGMLRGFVVMLHELFLSAETNIAYGAFHYLEETRRFRPLFLLLW